MQTPTSRGSNRHRWVFEMQTAEAVEEILLKVIKRESIFFWISREIRKVVKSGSNRQWVFEMQTPDFA